MPDTIGQRFTQLIQQLELSKNAFALSLDKTATVIQHLVDERNKPGYDLLCKVFEVYPNVSKDWLLLGRGPMLLADGAPTPPAVGPAAVASAAPATGAIDLAEVTGAVRRRAAGGNALLQPADIVATVALAAAHTQPSTRPPASASEPAALEDEAAPAAVTAPPSPSPSSQTVASAAPIAAPIALVPLAVAPAPAPTAPPDPTYLTALLQAQHLQHQLALAEQRNQHLLVQQQLLQQMVQLLQRPA